MSISHLPSPSDALAVAVDAAQRAAQEIRAIRHSADVGVTFKSDRNLVTKADVAAERLIIETIRNAYPGHAILAEESSVLEDSAQFSSGPVWVIDPVDGTTNFAHGHTQVGVSIGYAVDSVALAGVVLAPFQDEVFTATSGGGAFLNGRKIFASPTTLLADALIGTGFPYARDHVDIVCSRLARVLARSRDVRRIGAASLDISWVACGRLDGFFEETLMPWDCCAARLIAAEAGARVGHFPYDHDGQRKTAGFSKDLFTDNIAVATSAIFDELMSVLKARD